MNRLLIGKKLKLELMLTVLLSLGIAVGVFVVFEVASESILDDYFSKSAFTHNKEQEALQRFRVFVSEQNISTHDEEKLSDWVREERYLDLYIFDENQLMYTSKSDSELYVSKQLLTRYFTSYLPITTLSFADQDAQIHMVGFYEYQYYNLILIISISLAAIVFILSFLLIINKKTSYIGKLEQEIKILEGGNLEYPITITGNDEISSLAQSLDEMRKSFKDRLHSEDKVRVANRELITAISHDLRTPLTILLGYMDIIQLNKFKTQDDLMQYIRNSRDKAYQIQALSDKLFEHFTVSTGSESEDIDRETYDGHMLLDQLLEEQRFVPNRKPFRFEIKSTDEDFEISVNLVAIRRVFDNIFSNLQKYADRSYPVGIKYFLQGQSLKIVVSNKIKRVRKKKDSNKIGLISCTKIVEQHNGTLVVHKQEGFYTLEITLPLALDQ